MKVVYSNHQIENSHFDGHSIFLAGPTPRKADVLSWRPEALDILKYLNYDGVVFVPEWDTNFTTVDYLGQVTWERVGLTRCSKIVFWVPREMKDMPALTTNVEFGYFLAKTPDKVLYGRPESAVSCRYLDWLYSFDTSRRPFNDLGLLLKKAIEV